MTAASGEEEKFSDEQLGCAELYIKVVKMLRVTHGNKNNNHDCNTCSYSVFNGNNTCPAVQAVNKPINYSHTADRLLW